MTLEQKYHQLLVPHVGSNGSHEPYMYLYGDTIATNSSKPKIIHVVGKCQIGKTTTVRHAVSIGEGKIYRLCEDKTLFNYQTQQVVSGGQPPESSISLLVLLTNNIRQGLDYLPLSLTQEYCRTVLNLPMVTIALIEKDVPASAQLFLSEINAIVELP